MPSANYLENLPIAVEATLHTSEESTIYAYTEMLPYTATFFPNNKFIGVMVNKDDCVFVGTMNNNIKVWASLLPLRGDDKPVWADLSHRALVAFWMTKVEDAPRGRTLTICPLDSLRNVVFNSRIQGQTLAEKYAFIYDALLEVVFGDWDM